MQTRPTFAALVLAALALAAAGPLAAQPLVAACNMNCGLIDVDCQQKQADCQTKFVLYDLYLTQMGAGVLLYSLPPIYQEILGSRYPSADMSKVRVGYSNRQPAGDGVIATCDCDKVYFSDATYVENLRLGTLQEDWSWVLHELRHFEQCQMLGSRDAFAKLWWDHLSAVDFESKLLNGQWKQIHDAMKMEQDADSRASSVLDQLKQCCIHPSNGGMVRPLAVVPMTVSLPAPLVGQTVFAGVQANHGADPLVFEWSLRGPSASAFSPMQPGAAAHTAQFTPNEAGSWHVRIRVKQAGGNSSPLNTDYEETRTVNVEPLLPLVSSLALTPATVSGGSSANAVVQVGQIQPGQSVQVSLSSNHSSASVPPSVTVTGGTGSAGSQTFAIATSLGPADRSVTIEARVGMSAVSKVLIVEGVGEPVILSSLEVSKTDVMTGELFEAVLMLDRPPPVSITVMLQSSDAALLSVPREVRFERGEQRKVIRISAARNVRGTVPVTIQGLIGDDINRRLETQVRVQESPKTR